MSRQLRPLARLLLAILFISAAPFAAAQSYTSIVVFGDSLCDTGNDAAISKALYTVNAQVPGPASGYTNGRFTDGTDTSPAARLYNGVWVEQLAAKFPAKPAVLNSLAGGTNYAYGFATTDVGTTEFDYGPGNALAFNANNMGLQLSTYLATNPVITSKTLFVVWGGANDLIAATTSAQIIAAASRDVAIVQQLIAAGATDFIVPNLPPLGLVPRFNGSAATSLPATGAAQAFDQALAAGLAGLPAANPGKTLHLYLLDTYTLFNTIVGPPIYTGFANVTAQSQFTAVNPDTYLFWDNLHPTTYGHSIIAATAATLIGTPIVTTTAVTSSNAGANLNAAVTFTASVTATSGTAMGTVTFLDGATPIGTGFLGGTTTTATTTFATSTLAAGPHTITAVYTGVNGYVSSTSSALTETVTAPAYAPSATPSAFALDRGTSGSITLTVTPVGGYTGSFTLACGTLPAKFTCALGSTTLAVTSTTAASTTVVIGTGTTLALRTPAPAPWATATQIVAAFTFLPILGGLALFRRRTRSLPLLGLLLMLSAGALIGVSGCSSGPNLANDVAVGTYQIPITVTPATGTASTVTLNVTVQ